MPDARSRRARKKQRTRCEIYNAAMELFERDGFDGVTLEALCERADVARATFFLHFPSKAALLFEYSRRIAAEVEAKLETGSRTAAEDFRLLTRLLVDHWLERAQVLGRMLRELLGDPSALARAAADGETQLADLIASIVRRGQEQGEFRAHIAPELAAAVFLSSSTAFLAGSLRSEPPLRAGQIRDQFMELMLSGLLQPDPAALPRGSRERRS